MIPVLSALQNAKVIGLGEPTHGTAEVFRLKHRLIRQLVEKGGVRHLILEASVRVHNDTASQDVRIYGMEAQYADRSARRALSYLRTHDAARATQLRDAFGAPRVASDTASATLFAHLYGALSDTTLTAYQTLFLGLRATMDARRDTFVAASGAQAFKDARRHVTAIGQFTSLALLEHPAARAQLRDYVMAVNVAAIVADVPDTERVVVWAHNVHVLQREGNGGYDVLGLQLARWYGPAYYAIGFDFGSGAYRAPGPNTWVHEVPAPTPGSFTASMASAGQPDLFLNIRGALGTPNGVAALQGPFTVRATAGGQVPMRNGVRVFDQTLSLSDRFDGLFFVARTTPTTPLRR